MPIEVLILITIAQLCLTSNGLKGAHFTYDFQLECQQKYIKCVEEKTKKTTKLPTQYSINLKECVLEK